MNDIKNNKKLIFFCILLIITSVVIYFVLNKYNQDSDLSDNIRDQNEEYLKNYEINQFIPVYVTESDMARNYLNDYKNKMISNVNDAYESLNKEYRDKRFGSFESYKEYVNHILSLSTYSLDIDKYSVTSSGGDKLFNVYDTDGYHYIFREKSIMNYEVYLDTSTIQIK